MTHDDIDSFLAGNYEEIPNKTTSKDTVAAVKADKNHWYRNMKKGTSPGPVKPKPQGG